MQKNPDKHWQRHLRLAMLCALCFGNQGVAAQNSSTANVRELKATHKELQLAFAEVSKENESLEQKLARCRDKLQKLREAHADLAADFDEQAAELAGMRSSVVAMLPGYNLHGATWQILQLSEMLLEKVNQARLLDSLLGDFDQYINAVLVSLNSSRTLRRETAGRIGRLRRLVTNQQRLPPEVAGRGGVESRLRREAMILAVNDDLRLAIIDAGRMHSIRSGSTWRVIEEDGEVLGVLKVIATRAALSAAVPVDGKFKRLAPGLTVRLGLGKDFKE
ncbi:MAG: hypothetical protein R6V56_00550 [Lentisphaeria bacterium]